MAKKVWKPGDTVSYKQLNEMQQKADEYDRIYPEYQRLVAAVEAEIYEESE